MQTLEFIVAYYSVTLQQHYLQRMVDRDISLIMMTDSRHLFYVLKFSRYISENYSWLQFRLLEKHTTRKLFLFGLNTFKEQSGSLHENTEIESRITHFSSWTKYLVFSLTSRYFKINSPCSRTRERAWTIIIYVTRPWNK